MTDLSPAPLVRAAQLSRRTTKLGRPILDNIDFDLLAGQRVGLFGATGCGKSTLLRAIAMLDPGGEGQILFRGAVVQASDVPAYRRRVVYLPQRPAMVMGTVRDNLHLPWKMGVTVPGNSRPTSDIFRRLGKEDNFADQEIDSLSGGERQIVALVRALQLDPIVLLLDEPTASLDAKSTGEVEKIVSDWHDGQSDRAYLWVSHDRDQIARVTEITLLMDAGMIRVSKPQ